MPSQTKEDYLRALYLLYEGQEDKSKGIKAVDIAAKLGVSKPSVSEMLTKLVKEDLIRTEPYGPVFFTETGIVEARKVIRKKRIIELYLTDKLGYCVDEIEDEVHRLEHAFSEEVIERMAKQLNNPELCAHGREIPKPSFLSKLTKGKESLRHSPSRKGKFLSDVSEGTKVRIKDIDAGLNLKKRLLDHAIYEGTEVTVVKNDTSGPLVIKALDSKVCIGRGQARKILVKYERKTPHGRAGRKSKRW